MCRGSLYPLVAVLGLLAWPAFPAPAQATTPPATDAVAETEKSVPPPRPSMAPT